MSFETIVYYLQTLLRIIKMRHIRKYLNTTAIQQALNNCTYEEPYVCLNETLDVLDWNELKATADAGTANSTIQEHYWTGGGAEIDTLGKSIDGSVADSFYVDKKGKRNLW